MAKQKKRKKGKIIIIVLAVIAILIALFVSAVRKVADSVSFFTEETAIRRDIVNYFAFFGNVETINNTTVLSEVSQKVLQVMVEAGDEVKAGDTIAVLDSSEIEQSIESKKISMSSAEINDSYNINSAKTTYEDYKAGIENGTNAQMVSAQNTLDNALSKLESTKKEYDKAKDTVNNKSDSSLLSAQQSLEAAGRKLETAKNEYETILEKYNAKTDSSLLSAQQSVEAAERKLESAENTYRDYLDRYDGYEEEYFDTSLEVLIEDIDKARVRRDEAKAAWSQAKEAYDTELEAYTEALDKKTGTADEKRLKNLADMVSKTEQEYFEAQYDYADAMTWLTDVDEKLYDTIVSYRNSYLSAKDAYDSAVRSLTDVQKSLDKNLSSCYEVYLTAQETYKTAERNLADVKSGADSNLEKCYDNYVKAKKEYEDAKENYATTELNVSKTLQSYKDSYEKTEKLAELSTASLDLAKLYDQLENCTIKASADGIISELKISEGSYVTANQSVAVITDFSEMKLSIEISEYDLMKIKEGDEVEVHINATEDVVPGTIDTISLTAHISGGVAYFDADVRFEAGENVRPGMSAEVKLISQQALQVISIPVDALNYTENNMAYVFVKGAEGQQEQRNVTVGVSDGTYIEITEGLSENEMIMYIPPATFDMFSIMANTED